MQPLECQYWLRYWRGTWRHQAITWATVPCDTAWRPCDIAVIILPCLQSWCRCGCWRWVNPFWGPLSPSPFLMSSSSSPSSLFPFSSVLESPNGNPASKTTWRKLYDHSLYYNSSSPLVWAFIVIGMLSGSLLTGACRYQPCCCLTQGSCVEQLPLSPSAKVGGRSSPSASKLLFRTLQLPSSCWRGLYHNRRRI